jgi:hypothetical protein
MPVIFLTKMGSSPDVRGQSATQSECAGAHDKEMTAMQLAPRIARLGTMAIGLGIGAALATIPGTAAADTWPPPFDPNDFAISIDGYTLFHDGTATATSGSGDIAIADGANSTATATGGPFDSATAYGDDTNAISGGGNGYLDTASAVGDNSLATAEDGNFDTAQALGNGDNAGAESGNFDSASVSGGTTSLALAGYGNNDTATVLGTFSGSEATYGNDNMASVINTGTSAEDTAFAGGNTSVTTVLGNDDIATVFGTGSDATSGSDASTPGDFDLAAVFGDMLHTMATGVDNLFQILS